MMLKHAPDPLPVDAVPLINLSAAVDKALPPI